MKRGPPKLYPVVMTVGVTEALAKRIFALADYYDRSTPWVIRKIIENGIERSEELMRMDDKAKALAQEL